jgi:glycerophosphoryl diester phosphodiesterase
MANQSQRPLIFAHRGASAYAPENTLAAFEIAIQQGADWIEMDAKLSADQQVVIIHDRTVDRTTDGSGRVSDLPLSSLKKLNASYEFRDQYPHENIPTFSEVLELCTGRIRINLELGNYATPFDHLPEELAKIIKNHPHKTSILVSAFHPVPLRKFHSIEPEVKISLLARRGIAGYLSRGWLGRRLIPYDALHPDKSDVTPSMIKTARKFGYLINPFTVNDRAEMVHLISLGVNGLITDDPRLAGEVIVSMFPT